MRSLLIDGAKYPQFLSDVACAIRRVEPVTTTDAGIGSSADAVRELGVE